MISSALQSDIQVALILIAVDTAKWQIAKWYTSVHLTLKPYPVLEKNRIADSTIQAKGMVLAGLRQSQRNPEHCLWNQNTAVFQPF